MGRYTITRGEMQYLMKQKQKDGESYDKAYEEVHEDVVSVRKLKGLNKIKKKDMKKEFKKDFKEIKNGSR